MQLLTFTGQGVVHVVGFVVSFIVLGAMAEKNSAHFVFVETSNQTGWENDGVAWMVGLISSVYPFLGYDAACHLAEEIPHPSRNVPLAIMGSISINGLMGFAFFVMLLFSTGPLDSVLNSATGFPFIQIFLNSTKSHGAATFLSLFPIVIALAAAIAGVTSTSRTLYAFARDDATPFSRFLSRVDPKTQQPTRALWTVSILQGLLGFIYLGSSTAFNAILSMAIIGMYLSYFLPISAMLLYGRRRIRDSEYGPFKLGKTWGIILNVVSICWMGISMLFSVFPAALPVLPENMNYSVVVMSGWLLFGIVYYVAFGRRQFKMPIVEAGVILGIAPVVDAN